MGLLSHEKFQSFPFSVSLFRAAASGSKAFGAFPLGLAQAVMNPAAGPPGRTVCPALTSAWPPGPRQRPGCPASSWRNSESTPGHCYIYCSTRCAHQQKQGLLHFHNWARSATARASSSRQVWWPGQSGAVHWAHSGQASSAQSTVPGYLAGVGSTAIALPVSVGDRGTEGLLGL